MGADPSNLIFVASAAIDLALVAAVVLWALREPERLGLRLAGGAAVVLAALAVKGIVLLRLGLDVPFGVAHVLWLDLVVVLPGGAPLLLAAGRGRLGVGLRLLAFSAVLLAPVGAYASLVEPERLELETATVPLSPKRAGTLPLRVGVISDIQCTHVGGHERKAVRRLMAERPDVILLAGDYHQGDPAQLRRELPHLRALLRHLRAPGGVYAVQGDSDGLDEMRTLLRGTGVRLLDNEIARTRVRGRLLTIGGVRLAYWEPGARALADRLERLPARRDVRILLGHRPDVVLGLRERSRIDLTVGGHTHGGQIQLPLIGPPTVASRIPRSVGAGGLHTLAGRRIYVSRGVGVERGQAPRIRLGAVPEVALLSLG